MKHIIEGNAYYTEDFELYDELVVLGNFYAEGNIHVNGLKVEGDIHLESSNINNPPCLNAMFVRCAGRIFAHNYVFRVDDLRAQKGRCIINDGAISEHAPIS